MEIQEDHQGPRKRINTINDSEAGTSSSTNEPLKSSTSNLDGSNNSSPTRRLSSSRRRSSLFASIEEVVTCGKTRDGKVFQVPQTLDMVHTLFSFRKEHSAFEVCTVLIMLFQIAIVWWTRSQFLALSLFICWRLLYNVGLGLLLYLQSRENWMINWVQEKKLLSNPWLVKQLKLYMNSESFQVENIPIEFHSWLLFRNLVDLILLNDFVSYILFALCYFNTFDLVDPFSWFRLLTGAFLILFNVWVKMDAHRVIKDFAWYWGDFFFLIQQDLTFDGVFEMAPHPMYSVGYAWYYGVSMITSSYTVFFVSLLAHALQFIFLLLVENPHIQKTYGNINQKLLDQLDKDSILYSGPSPYFRRDLIVFANFDIFRSNDLFTLLFCVQIALTLFMPLPWYFYFYQALFWRAFHSIGLGLLLLQQSEDLFLTRHFIKCGGDQKEAFYHWKSIYNFSLLTTYGSFVICVLRFYDASEAASYFFLFRHLLGLVLIMLHLWTSLSVYEVLGDFGWFYGDFFIAEYQNELYYTGIYRFLNNPEKVLGQAAFWGMACIAYDTKVFILALLSHIASFWFLEYVEKPHMINLYGDKVREEAGAVKSVLDKVEHFQMIQDAQKLTQKAGKAIKEKVNPVVKKNVVEPIEQYIRPKINQIVMDTKQVIDETAFRMTARMVKIPLSEDEMKLYSVTIHSSKLSLGQSLTVRWKAPKSKSSLDWIAIYPIGSNPSAIVTTSKSKDHWKYVPEGDEENGQLVFEHRFMPFSLGQFEIRYHYSDTYMVICRSEPFSIEQAVYREDAEEAGIIQFNDEVLGFFSSIWSNIVGREKVLLRDNDDGDKEIQLKSPILLFSDLKNGEERVLAQQRIVYATKCRYEVDFEPSVLLAFPSIESFSKKIFEARKILSSHGNSDTQ